MEEIELDLDDDVILYLALEAHKRDITLNEYINEILKKCIDGFGTEGLNIK
jgi:predicted HicB family RNase H-like nuclease